MLGLGAYGAWRHNRRSLLFPVAFAVAVGVATVPQIPLSDPFKFELARLQAGLGDLYFRYATDVTGCGPAPLSFSPLADEAIAPEAAGKLAPKNALWRITAAVAHVVSGWDARPSPTYMDFVLGPPVACHVCVLRVRDHGGGQRCADPVATA